MTDLEIYQMPTSYTCPMCGRDPEPFKRWWRFRYHAACVKYTEPHIHITCSSCGYDYGIQTYQCINETMKLNIMKVKEETGRNW